ncbi:MAG TPA: sulfotransferase family protein [Chromatiaceae bacterium]|nr:sulfotransferase family protein [Chromatiaceae bacterium]
MDFPSFAAEQFFDTVVRVNSNKIPYFNNLRARILALFQTNQNRPIRTIYSPSKTILALWCTPRSRSSAFLMMMKQRKDFEIRPEPFEASAYYSDERILGDNCPADPEWPREQYNYDKILDSLKSQLQKCGKLFVKDHPFYFIHVVNENFLNSFFHTFLIRHPKQALPSYFNVWPNVTFQETGYEAQRQMFEYVLEHTGKMPIVIDADDLVNKPEATIRAYCSHVGIPFIPESLRWDLSSEEKNGLPELWHSTLKNSAGIQTTNNSYLGVHENDDLEKLYNASMPHYTRMLANKLIVT